MNALLTTRPSAPVPPVMIATFPSSTPMHARYHAARATGTARSTRGRSADLDLFGRDGRDARRGAGPVAEQIGGIGAWTGRRTPEVARRPQHHTVGGQRAAVGV